jgi:hypothetical protein
MPRPFFAFVRHPAVIAELLPYLSGYKWFFHDAAENMSLHTRLKGPVKEDAGIESRTD